MSAVGQSLRRPDAACVGRRLSSQVRSVVLAPSVLHVPLSQLLPIRRAGRAAAVRPAAAAAQAAPTASGGPHTTDAQAQAVEELLSQPGFKGNVYLASGEYGRGLFVRDDVASTSASGGAASRAAPVSVALRNTLCIVKKKDPDVRGSLAWHEQYLQDWQAGQGTQLPEKLLKLLRNDKEMDLYRLAAWLTWAVANTPFWASYASKLMPVKGVLQSLMWAQPVHQEALQDDTLATDRLRGQVTDVRDKVLRVLREECGMGDVTQEDVEWCMDLVTTRSIGIAMSSTYVLMVPLVDMANHSRSASCNFHLDLPTNTFQIIHRPGAPPVKAGTELLVCYNNDLPSRELLYHFGFLTPGNPLDRVALPRDDALPPRGARLDVELVTRVKRDMSVALPKGDGGVAAGRLDAAASSLIASADTGWKRRQPGGNEVHPMYAQMREEAARRQTGAAMQQEQPEDDPLQSQLDDIATLERMVASALQRMGTSAQEDELLLVDQRNEAGGASPKDPLTTQCIVYRLERKRILEQATAILGAVREQLQSSATATAGK